MIPPYEIPCENCTNLLGRAWILLDDGRMIDPLRCTRYPNGIPSAILNGEQTCPHYKPLNTQDNDTA